MNASIEVIARSSSPAHAYPHDLAGLVRKRWCEVHGVEEAEGAGTIGLEDALPDPDTLERLLSVCYQASLLHEEGRPVTFRLAVADPACFVADAGPPAGLHRVVFTTPRPFDPHELRRLAPAATFQRSLIGVRGWHPSSGHRCLRKTHATSRRRDRLRSIPRSLENSRSTSCVVSWRPFGARVTAER